MIPDRQTHTQTDMLITILIFHIGDRGGRVKIFLFYLWRFYVCGWQVVGGGLAGPAGGAPAG